MKVWLLVNLQAKCKNNNKIGKKGNILAIDILSLPQAYIRKVISDVIAEQPFPEYQLVITAKTIERLSGRNKTTQNPKMNIEINKLLSRTILGMIESGKIIQNKDGRLSLNRHYIPSPIQDINVFSIDGEKRFSSMGSDKYPIAWKNLPVEQKLVVEVVPELDNPKDRTAVSIRINNQIMAYFPREIAHEYHEKLLARAQTGQMCITTVTVKVSPVMPDYKYAEISVREAHEI